MMGEHGKGRKEDREREEEKKGEGGRREKEGLVVEVVTWNLPETMQSGIFSLSGAGDGEFVFTQCKKSYLH